MNKKGYITYVSLFFLLLFCISSLLLTTKQRFKEIKLKNYNYNVFINKALNNKVKLIIYDYLCGKEIVFKNSVSDRDENKIVFFNSMVYQKDSYYLIEVIFMFNYINYLENFGTIYLSIDFEGKILDWSYACNEPILY